jgi:primase-polymerase (primpol)-like protein
MMIPHSTATDTAQTTPRSTLYTGPTAEDLAHIPAELKARRQWVLWRGADKMNKQSGEITGLDKIPINPQTLRGASTTDPTTWGTFEQCVTALPVALEEWEQDDPSAYRGGGIGYVFAPEDPYGLPLRIGEIFGARPYLIY